MAPYEALYGRWCRSLVGWFKPGEARLLGTDLVQDTLEKVKLIQDRLRMEQSRKKSYTDWKVRDIAYMVGEKVLLRVLPMKDVLRFVKKGKFSPRYIGPFEVLERIGQVSYKLALPPSLSGVPPVFYISMSQKYYGDLSHVLDFSTSLDTSKTGEYVPSGEASKGNSMQAQPEVQSHQIPKQFPRRFHLVDESSSYVGSSKGSEDFEPSSSHAPTTLINIEYDDKVPDDGRWGDIIVGGLARLWKPKEWVDRFLSEKAYAKFQECGPNGRSLLSDSS
ncbi:uncharacterized protein [Nicotiana sylvestris]|uniref:uncharacterized protein n=1 Tax=Nicotiana sylvestris TaxID=4096 RepID=UPI00388C3DF8